MKAYPTKIFVILLTLSTLSAGVTFNLNTSTGPGFTDTTSTLVIRGSMNGWAGNDWEMSNLGGDYWLTYAEDYSFDLTFPEWFEGTFKRPKDRPNYRVTNEEFNLVKEFYVKNIYEARDKETQIEYI